MKAAVVLIIVLAASGWALDHMLADITEPMTNPFGTYVPIPVTVTPDVAPWEIEPDLSNVINADQFTLTEQEKALLAANSFIVIPAPGRAEVYDVYNENRETGVPTFVSTDAFLHAYHVLFDWILKKAELTNLFDTLKTMNTTLVAAALGTYDEASSAAELSAATRLLAFHCVAASLLDSTFQAPASVTNLVSQELNLIYEHAGMQMSPSFSYDEDYSQYLVRGHYTTNDTLAAYFRAMMWYGRMAFMLDEEFPDGFVRDHTLSALLLARDMALHSQTQTDWHAIYWPTVFFVGRSDDVTPQQYETLAETVYGAPLADLSVADLADVVLLGQFIDQAREEFAGPQIANASFLGMRLMGQRFIPDSYVFEQVVFPHCVRTTPRGLDIMASLGCDRAREILDEVYGEFTDPQYVAQLDSMREYMASVSDSTWAGNLYYNWLYSLMPLLFEKGEGWPVFMTNPAWSDRELSTSLMSWGELRHDTILYAKQSYALCAPPGAALLLNYVEPNPYLWARLAALAEYTHSGLSGLGLLGPLEAERLARLGALCRDLREISLLELTDGQLSPAQDGLLGAIGASLQVIISVEEEWLHPGEPDWEEIAQTPVIADVHTDLVTFQALEEGVGYPWVMLVAVRRADVIVLTRGVHVPYYEFTVPYDERMTDEAWRGLLTGSAPPAPPVWTESYRDASQSLLNPMPRNYFAERKYVGSLSFTLTPAEPDTGTQVDVDVYWNSHCDSPYPPLLTILTPGGDTLDVPLQQLSWCDYQGTFTTVGWRPGDAVLWFQCPSIFGNLLDWRTILPVGPASGSGPSPDPTEFTLSGVAPNPTAGKVSVSFTIPEAGPVRLSVFDLSGRERAVLAHGRLAAGSHRLEWNTVRGASLLPQGVYVLRLCWNGQEQTQRVVLMR
ncbi:DUF3160 domain-containing protein [Candidatus Fermentibacteria bacterium]|nr:DUF3160 domain-containing protein [Candidatus Fermentibacteria bacterium]